MVKKLQKKTRRQNLVSKRLQSKKHITKKQHGGTTINKTSLIYNGINDFLNNAYPILSTAAKIAIPAYALYKIHQIYDKPQKLTKKIIKNVDAKPINIRTLQQNRNTIIQNIIYFNQVFEHTFVNFTKSFIHETNSCYLASALSMLYEIPEIATYIELMHHVNKLNQKYVIIAKNIRETHGIIPQYLNTIDPANPRKINIDLVKQNKILDLSNLNTIQNEDPFIIKCNNLDIFADYLLNPSKILKLNDKCPTNYIKIQKEIMLDEDSSNSPHDVNEFMKKMSSYIHNTIFNYENSNILWKLSRFKIFKQESDIEPDNFFKDILITDNIPNFQEFIIQTINQITIDDDINFRYIMLNLNQYSITNNNVNTINIHDFLLSNPHGYFTCNNGHQYKIRGFICLEINAIEDTDEEGNKQIYSTNHYIYYKNCTNRILEYDDIKTKLQTWLNSGQAYKEFIQTSNGFFNIDNNRVLSEINRRALEYPKIILIEKITQTITSIENKYITDIIGGTENIENNIYIYNKIKDLFTQLNNLEKFNSNLLELTESLNDIHVNQMFTNNRSGQSYLCYNYTAYLFIRYIQLNVKEEIDEQKLAILFQGLNKNIYHDLHNLYITYLVLLNETDNQRIIQTFLDHIFKLLKYSHVIDLCIIPQIQQKFIKPEVIQPIMKSLLDFITKNKLKNEVLCEKIMKYIDIVNKRQYPIV